MIFSALYIHGLVAEKAEENRRKEIVGLMFIYLFNFFFLSGSRY